MSIEFHPIELHSFTHLHPLVVDLSRTTYLFRSTSVFPLSFLVNASKRRALCSVLHKFVSQMLCTPLDLVVDFEPWQALADNSNTEQSPKQAHKQPLVEATEVETKKSYYKQIKGVKYDRFDGHIHMYSISWRDMSWQPHSSSTYLSSYDSYPTQSTF